MKRLKKAADRRMARHIRDRHWQIMERMAKGPLRVCLWNRKRLPEQADEVRMCLITGMEWMNWVRRHRNWFRISRKLDAERDTHTMKLTKAGKSALRSRWRYDMEPVEGGLVEPGWTAIPSKRRERSGV